MTLSRLLVAAFVLAGTLAQAAVVLPNRPGRPGRPGQGGDYGPIQPYPGQDDYGPGRGDDYGPGRGRRTSEEIYVNRYVRNESIDLMRELSHLRGHRVEAVHVYITRSREVNASVELLVNRRSEDSRRADVGRAVTLAPRSLLEIGRHLDDLAVYARGEMLIDRIVVELSSEGPVRPPDYDNGREVVVTLNLPAYFPPQPRLDLTPYIDIHRYRGYAIRGVEITAVARYNTASLDVLLNGFSEGQIVVSTRQSTQSLRSRQNLVIGSSFGNLVVAPRGDSNIIQVRLILSR